ncbi:MAG TPA: hypothetical protein VM029_21840, partial [Opitutaceae bacterium]|nr:hypothetical protein [Opitutaceae bacterium]
MAKRSAQKRAAPMGGLRYSRDTEPGFSRQGEPGKFAYHDAKGRAIRDDSVLERIRGLVIPPAWT